MFFQWRASRNPTVRGWQRWMFFQSDASKNPTLPRWQRWMFFQSDASRNPTVPRWQRWMFFQSDASRNPTVPRWQRWMFFQSHASRNPTVPRWQRSSNQTLLETRRSQGGSDGCSSNGMLLETLAKPQNCYFAPWRVALRGPTTCVADMQSEVFVSTQSPGLFSGAGPNCKTWA